MEEVLNALSEISYNMLHSLKTLYQAKVVSRMRSAKISKMVYTSDLIRMAMSCAVALKENQDHDPEDMREKFGELGRDLALWIYDMDTEKLKHLINEEAERCKKIADRSNTSE
jgi:hypothetical protein